MPQFSKDALAAHDAAVLAAGNADVTSLFPGILVYLIFLILGYQILMILNDFGSHFSMFLTILGAWEPFLEASRTF